MTRARKLGMSEKTALSMLVKVPFSTVHPKATFGYICRGKLLVDFKETPVYYVDLAKRFGLSTSAMYGRIKRGRYTSIERAILDLKGDKSITSEEFTKQWQEKEDISIPLPDRSYMVTEMEMAAKNHKDSMEEISNATIEIVVDQAHQPFKVQPDPVNEGDSTKPTKPEQLSLEPEVTRITKVPLTKKGERRLSEGDLLKALKMSAVADGFCVTGVSFRHLLGGNSPSGLETVLTGYYVDQQ